MGNPDRAPVTGAFETLKQAIIELLHAVDAKSPLPQPILSAALKGLREADVSRHPITGGPYFPALDMLPGFAAKAPGGPFGDVLRALNACKGGYPWIQNANYRGRPEMQGYLANSVFGGLIGGPAGLAPCGEAVVGFWMMGPNIDYPAHTHPAEELYVILSGEADWYRESDGWTRRRPGDHVLNTSMIRHGMRTGGEPLIALYCWRGDLATLPTSSAAETGQPLSAVGGPAPFCQDKGSETA